MANTKIPTMPHLRLRAIPATVRAARHIQKRYFFIELRIKGY
jgi:hypothetical protein